MALITDLPASSSVASTDLFVKDTGSATQKITAADLFPSGLRTSVVLYNSGKVDNGTITLVDAYTNYKFLLIDYITNSDKCSQFIPADRLDTGSIMQYVAGGAWNTSLNCFQYESTCFINKISNTQLNISSAYRDANWNLGVARILGFK